eukprot:CAMPEP_0198219834 /NCGR_PEP_ID=MMETSP1445-20131203/76443_1 /TAXON_ID=36898 /ORGANISM="Pyramimonas sp., Strain CCMP2087" /LENGTH=354 /DNA_ID=CAMNT_0043897393 /DNA_START=504 /DNA_END=1565 /DNA_ORIENTATION=+
MNPEDVTRGTQWVVSTLLLLLTAWLLVTDPQARRLLSGALVDETTGKACDDDPRRTSCPNDCSGRGSCTPEDTCLCKEGFAGQDCTWEHCPSDCNHRGTCNEGICLCNAAYGGHDCSIDRLDYLTDKLLDDVHFDLDFKDTCQFLTKLDGDKVDFWSDATSKLETYTIPEEMGGVLPDVCPEYKFDTCAVVGNSGTVLFEEFGAEIDAHEMVYRFNQGPTLGYEKFIGNHTMFESLNAKFAHQLMRGDGSWQWRDPLAVYILFEPLKLQDAYVAIKTKYPSLDVMMFSPEFFVRVHQIYDRMLVNLEKHEFGCFTGEKPMSGFYAVLYALSTCKQVDLYGFDPWTDAMARDRTR